MKKSLLHKTLLPITLYSLFVLSASVPAYYYLVDSIWLEELDEHNLSIAKQTENELNKLNLSDEELAGSILLWNKIQPGTNLKELPRHVPGPDSVYTVWKQDPYEEHKDIDRFRGLARHIMINDKPYELIIETNIEETEEIVLAISLVTLFFFLVLVAGFLLLNRKLSAQLWKPFRNTLDRLKSFNLSSQTSIAFEKTDILEFEELNDVLQKLIAKNISVYRLQKEFTENASHELQTPLAIIKNKLDLLLQKETLTDRQYQIIEEANKALTRLSRINKNLLLLAKIENHQFDNNESIPVSSLISQSLGQLKEHSDNKNLEVVFDPDAEATVNGNKTLCEILINNLLLNAIRHNNPNGIIRIKADQQGISVANSGSNALDSEAMFKRFANVSSTNAGSGLGLAIIRQICLRHGWNISYQFSDHFHIFRIRF